MQQFIYLGSNRSWLSTAILSILLCGSAVHAQAQKKQLGTGKDPSASGQTGTGSEGSRTAAAETGGADSLGNPLLGGLRRPLYRLRSSDVVEVTFTVAPEFNQLLTVQPDGFVTLKDAGTTVAEGRTLEEFSEAVKRAYRGYLHDPEVAVSLKDFEHPSFIVGGQVARPGKYELRADTTVAEAVQIAGGMTPQAKHSQVVLFRRVDENLVETRLLNLKKMLNQHGLQEDAHLRPGDFIFVPQNALSKIDRFITRPSMGVFANAGQF
ncbi:MAG TPA: polysaccharide biosynthesis/export family protein [Candidatus Sulfotelmatobacter sp.]